MQLGDRNLMIVAHPDDESCWGGLLLIKHGRRFDIICCSFPRRASEVKRAVEFYEACKYYGTFGMLMPHQEENPQEPLKIFYEPEWLDQYDVVITHGCNGEYGHIHHITLHHFIKDHAKCPIYCFGYGKGEIILEATNREYDSKIEALKKYVTHSGLEPKWKALLKRYPIIGERKEYYTRVQ